MEGVRELRGVQMINGGLYELRGENYEDPVCLGKIVKHDLTMTKVLTRCDWTLEDGKKYCFQTKVLLPLDELGWLGFLWKK